MNNILVLLGVGVAGGFVLNKIIKFGIGWVKKALLKKLDFVKDPDLKALFLQAIVIAQKKMGDAPGIEKKAAAKAWLLKMIPDAFDSLVESAFDTAWDEIMKPLSAEWKDVPEALVKEVNDADLKKELNIA
jgi:hypothetical protein